MNFLTIFTKTENIDQSADFFIATCVLGGRSKSSRFTKNYSFFLHTQACLKRPIFRQIKTQCHSEGIPISYRRLSATKKHPPRPINLRLLQP